MADEIIARAKARALGLKRYFTGKPCKRGHVAQRQVSSLTCVECDRERHQKVYRTCDKAKRREAGRRWRAANRDKVNSAERARARTPEAKAKASAYYQANREKIRAQQAATYKRDEAIARSKAWAEANPERAREHFRMNTRRRRAQKRGSGATHSAADLAEILAAQGHRCAYCRADLRKTKKHVDHIQPLALGGSNGRANLQYLCAPCNQSKNARDPIDYAQSLGLLI